MKRPEDLSHQELAELVRWLVDKTFMEHDEDGQSLGRYDPENVVDRSDSLTHLAGSLLLKGLAPAAAGDAPPAIENPALAELQRAHRLAREVRDILRKTGARQAHSKAADLVKSVEGAVRNERGRRFRPSTTTTSPRPRRRRALGRDLGDLIDAATDQPGAGAPILGGPKS